MRRKNLQSGAAFVEFVLVVPILFVLLFGMFELGLLMLEYNILNKAVRDAASFWSNNGRDPATTAYRPLGDSLGTEYGGQSLQDVIENIVTCGRYDCTTATPLLPGAVAFNYPSAYWTDPEGQAYVTVEATYAHPVSLLPSEIGTTITIGASTTMRVP